MSKLKDFNLLATLEPILPKPIIPTFVFEDLFIKGKVFSCQPER